MHSSIISKIRILKPRKKCSVASKSFILSNENLHSTLRPNTIEVDDSSKLPNLIKNTDKNDFVDIVQLHQDSSPKLTNDWLPVYIVNVSDSTTPNLGGVVVTKEMAKVSIGGHGEAKTKSSVNIGNRYHISTRSQKRYFKKKTVRFPQSNKSETSKQETQVPSTEKTISCFLCPAKFKSVAAMQAHYLDKHKQKKRLDSQSSNCKLNVSPKKGLKPLKPKIFTEDEAKCPICSICFKTENEVNDHMTSVHCYKCSECQNTFYTLYQFTDHKCNTVNKVKRPKLKKKKSKPKLNSEKDPLIASPLLKVAVSKNDRNYVNNGHYPVANNMNEFKEPPVLYENTSSLPRYANAKCNSETTISTLAYDRPISSSKTQDSGVENRTSKEWMNFSFETLTSEEFNKEKLKELLSNPYLSVSPIKRSEHCSKVEFYSCGRCNVLCEDAADYVDHIEECLRLSNVSLICMDGPPNKMLKLNSKVVPKSGCDFSSFSINHKLIKALGNYLDSEIILGKETETNPSTVPVCDKKDINNGSFFHPDIKGNICVRKLESPSKKEVVSSCNGSSHLKTKNIKKKQPMVMIPVDKYLGVARTRKGTQAVGNIASTNSKHDDYPEISIIDKSNCITYNFHGSETSSLLKSDENRSHGGVLSEQESYQLALAKIRKSLLKQALQLKSNLSTSPSQPSDFVFPEVKDEKVSSFDLLLNEEEIKMEVEDEVVDDCFKDE